MVEKIFEKKIKIAGPISKSHLFRDFLGEKPPLIHKLEKFWLDLKSLKSSQNS